MSYRLEYQYALFVDESAGKPRYVVAVEGSDSNLYENKSGRRVRQWDVAMIGDETAVLKRAVYYAAACDGGSLKPMGRDCTAESYIARIRRLLKEGSAVAPRGDWYASLRMAVGHPAGALARSLELSVTADTWCGDPVECVSIPHHRRALAFEFAERFPDLATWALAKVAGLPAS